MSEKQNHALEAKQLIVDFYGCDEDCLDNIDCIRQIIRTICSRLDTEIVEECYHKFEPIGISAVAVIATSHLSIHTWPEYRYAAVDIFSCYEDIPGEILTVMKELFHADSAREQTVKRSLVRERRIADGS